MPHHITHRTLTSAEVALLRQARFSLMEGCGTVMIPAVYACGFAFLWILLALAFTGVYSLSGRERPAWFTEVFVYGIYVFGGFAWTIYFVRSLKARRRERKELKTGRVELIHVEVERAVQREPHNDEGPIYYFDVGGGKVLVLQGSWLLDPERYGLPPAEYDDNDELIGGEPFPVMAFTVHRLEESRDIIQFELEGRRAEITGVIPLGTKMPAWIAKPRCHRGYESSMLLDGPYDELAALARRSSSQD